MLFSTKNVKSMEEMNALAAEAETHMKDTAYLAHLVGRAYAEGLRSLTGGEQHSLMCWYGWDWDRYSEYREQRS